jgi:hypothetical protein
MRSKEASQGKKHTQKNNCCTIQAQENLAGLANNYRLVKKDKYLALDTQK